MYYRRLPLEGLCNARDLGGHPINGGGVTKFGRFIRCEAPRDLTEDDLKFLKEYGITLSIDFRGDHEVSRHPSRLEGLPWLKYLRCPTFSASFSPGSGGRPATEATVNWGEKYIEMAEQCRDWAGNVLRAMAASDGAVIYNCTTGKDRTGFISLLLLGLSGVSDPDIIADYCVSELYLTEIYKELLAEYLKRWPDKKAGLDSPFFKTAPENMHPLLEHVRENYGGIEAYVKSCGVSAGEAAALISRLTE